MLYNRNNKLHLLKIAVIHYHKHSFRDYIWETRNITLIEEYKEREDDPNSVANEEKKEQREILNKQIREKNNELNELDNGIHKSINDSIDKPSYIAIKDLELNKNALKIETKNGYCKELLEQAIYSRYL